MNAAAAQTASFAGFARLLGVKRHYVTQLKDAGRLVLTDDGQRVRIVESQARIAATADPSKAGVAARHAAARAEAAERDSDRDPGTPDGDDAQDAAAEALVATGRFYWTERAEKAKALRAERENAVAEGKLLDAAEVQLTIGRAAATLRHTLENLPIAVSPELAAETSETRIRALLTEAIEHALAETSRQFAALAKQETA